MNTTFREVLWEVLKGLLITEPNVKRSRIRGKCLGTKRIPRWSGFVLGCYAWRERERERQTEKHHHKEYPKKRKWKGTYAWTMHKHVTCKEKCIMGSTQSNPNSTQVSTYKHTSIMHETLWKCKCNALHEHITSYKQKPTQKIHKILINFKKPLKI